LETWVRERVQGWLQDLLEDEVTELLGRQKSARHAAVDALAVADDPAPAYRALERLVQPVRDAHGRAMRAFLQEAA
jgi:hypothetical protein